MPTEEEIRNMTKLEHFPPMLERLDKLYLETEKGLAAFKDILNTILKLRIKLGDLYIKKNKDWEGKRRQS